MRSVLKSGDEQDALTRWKNVCHWKPGQRKKIKRQVNRRIRKAWKVDL